jgi:hypothetical protein
MPSQADKNSTVNPLRFVVTNFKTELSQSIDFIMKTK